MRTNGLYHAALRAARVAAAAAPTVLRGVTATAEENLRLAFGEADPTLVRSIWRHFGEAAVDLLFFDRLFDPEKFGEHFVFEGGGLEEWNEIRPGAAVFATGHFGNWELYGMAFRHLGIEVAPIARPQQPAWLGRKIDRFRRAHGQETIPKKHAMPLAIKALRRGKAVAFLMDRYAGRHGVSVPFFGRPVQTFAAPAALALKFDIPLFAGYTTRLGPGIRYRCFAERIPVTGDPESLTRTLNKKLEGYVRNRPEQWFWFHRRFQPRSVERAGRRLSPAGIPILK